MISTEFNGLTLRQKARVNLASCYLAESERLRPQPYVYAGLKRIALSGEPVTPESVCRYVDQALIEQIGKPGY